MAEVNVIMIKKVKEKDLPLPPITIHSAKRLDDRSVMLDLTANGHRHPFVLQDGDNYGLAPYVWPVFIDLVGKKQLIVQEA